MNPSPRSCGLIAAVVAVDLFPSAGCLDHNDTLSIGEPLPLPELSLTHSSLVWVFAAEGVSRVLLGPCSEVIPICNKPRPRKPQQRSCGVRRPGALRLSARRPIIFLWRGRRLWHAITLPPPVASTQRALP